MNLLHLTAIAKISLCSIILGFASFQDWRTREISDVVWIVMGGFGATLTTIELLTDFSYGFLLMLAASVATCFFLGFGLYRLGFFGGADAKCLWCIGVTLPYNPLTSLGLSPVGLQNPIFSISIFNNSILTAAFLALGIMCFNAVMKTRRHLFSESEEKSLWKRFVVLALGYKMKISRVLEKKDFYFPLEVFSHENGRVKRRFKFTARCMDDDPYAELTRLVNAGIVSVDEEIWVSPAIPLIINITVGFLVSLLYGDLVLSIARAALSLTL
ncbi:MAG: A24 family peptidase C-terminal domain-containing protein [Candidatus Nezhaarchaeales archaeon]